MVAASYVYRLDDIAPEMDWEKFWRIMSVFSAHRVVPLLGVVPDNKDDELRIGREESRFWQIMRGLEQSQVAEFAQHGYQHILRPVGSGARRQKTEFAGLPYDLQYEKVQRGREILQEAGIFTDVWMAPAHSFDNTTLDVIRDMGFRAVTDGCGIVPYYSGGLVFVPQQLWRPRRMPFGYFTVCIHSNELTDAALQRIERHLRSGAHCVRFSEAVGRTPTGFGEGLNRVFCAGYSITRALLRR